MEILVYVDPSQRGEWALKAGELLVPAVADGVALLATEEDVRADPGLLERARARFAGRARAVRVVTRPGPAEKAVVAESRGAPFVLVVVPPAGRGALARLLRGSRVATVVREVRASVLVARRPPDTIRRVLVAVAGGIHSPVTTLAACQLASALGAEVHVLHVSSDVELPPHLPLVERRAPSARAREAARGFEHLEDVKQVLEDQGCDPRVQVREGLIVPELLEEIDEHAHDLLVIGAHRAEGASRYVLDDVTERILLHCPIPILVIRAPEPWRRQEA